MGSLLAGSLANAALRAANRPDPDEREPVRALFQHLLTGGIDPISVMSAVVQAASWDHGGQSSSGGNSSTSGGSNQRASRSLRNSPAVTRRARRRSRHEPDPSSELNDDLNDIRSVAYHFVRRLTRYVRLGGIGQYVTDATTGLVSRADVFYEGTSEHQDRSCSVPGHHAAHVVRVRLNMFIETDYPEIFEPLRIFVGHTHFVPQYANVWHGLGGEVDRIQARFLQEMSTINFRGDLTAETKDILRRLKQAFLDVFEAAIRSGRYTARQVRDLQEAIDAIREISLRELFEKGRDGYLFIPNNL